MSKKEIFRQEEPEETLPVDPTIDPFCHTPEHPFCIDGRCPCKEDAEAIGKVNGQYQDGLLTPEEATQIVRGRGSR